MSTPEKLDRESHDRVDGIREHVINMRTALEQSVKSEHAEMKQVLLHLESAEMWMDRLLSRYGNPSR